jgi:hypothetical protein
VHNPWHVDNTRVPHRLIFVSWPVPCVLNALKVSLMRRLTLVI